MNLILDVDTSAHFLTVAKKVPIAYETMNKAEQK